MPRPSALTSVDRSTLLKTHYAFQQGCFISEREEQSDAIFACSSASAAPMWNHVAWATDGSEHFDSFLTRATAWCSRRDRRPVIYLAEPTAAQQEILHAGGYEPFDEESWLVACAQGQLSDRIIEASAAMDRFIEIFSASFSAYSSGYSAALRNSSLQRRNFVLYSGETPVAIGTLAIEGPLACLYNVATSPSARNQGFGAEMVQHLVALARENDCEKVFLQVESGSPARRLYERLGFELAFTRLGFRLSNWTRPERKRSRLTQLFAARAGEEPRALIGRETRAISAELLASLTDAYPGCSHADLFRAAWVYLLHRYTGEEQVVLAIQSEGSLTEEVQIEIHSNARAREWVRGLAGSQRSASDLEAETLLSLASSGRGQFAALNYPLECCVTASKVDICYNGNLFSKDAIRRMATHYITALSSLAVSAHLPVRDIEILPESERQQILVAWNQSRFTPCAGTVIKFFEEQVERTPEALALILAGKSGEQLTYRQLNRRANRLAHHLQQIGVGPEVAVGVLLQRSLDPIVALLAILKAGGIFVPLDPESPSERIGYVTQEAETRVLITSRARARSLSLTKGLATIYLDEGIESLNAREKNPVSSASGESAAYIIYTSGSTGNPKGVLITHHALANHVIDCRAEYGLSAKDRVLQFSAFHFDASLEQILPALIAGATLVVRGDEVWTPAEFTQKLQEYQLTMADIPTAYWHELPEFWRAHPEALTSHCLRLMIVGGEALSGEKLQKWQTTPLAPVRLINAYGPTEATITATSCELPAERSDTLSSTVPIGRPRADRKLYVLDGLGRPVPIGVPGELHIGGTLLSRGYHKQPKLTAASFIQNPFSDDPDARLYKTGDLVRYREDSTLEYLGRIDDQVKVRGFRVEPAEIEAVLRRHPAVQDGIVIARPCENEKQLVGYALSKGASERELIIYLRQKLPEYMVPARVLILEAWPLLSNGKIDRRKLPDPSDAPAGSTAVRGPREPLELQLQLIFERVLKRAPIGIDQSFFELGGDSLQALELLVQIESETGKELPLGTLYQTSTVETLARELGARSAAGTWSSLVPLQARGSRPPLFLLHTTPGDVLGYGNLVYRLGPDQPCYGFQSLGLKDAHLSHTSIEQMAGYYVDLLRGFQPRGPYYLGGWCYGGIVAVEMARILKEQGEKIGLLALLETVAMPAGFSNLRYYLHRTRCLARMTPAGWLIYAREKWKYHRNARLANRMRFRQVECPTASERDRLVQLEQVYNTNLAALNRYRSSYYDGTVTLFNAAEADRALIPDSEYGWVGLARRIEIQRVPGNHDTMLTEPNVRVLARSLADRLERAGQGRKAP